MEPASTLSRAPMSFLGPSSCCGSIISSSETSESPFLRRCISTTFTLNRCSHVEKADSPRKVPILRKSCKKASWARSSASAVLPTIRRQSEYTRRLCSAYSASNDAASPALARSMASASVSPGTRVFFGCVNLPFQAVTNLRCGQVAELLYLKQMQHIVLGVPR